MKLLTSDMSRASRETEAAIRLSDEFDLRLAVQQQRLFIQDAWLLMYLLVDKYQDAGPPGREKYYSPRAANVVDTARRVISRNPIKYHVIGRHMAADAGEFRDQLRTFENVLHGMQYDIDRQLEARGEMNARQQASFHGLVRGAWAFKMHLSEKAKTSTGSPIHYVQYDPRLVMPNFDLSGQESAIAYNITTLASLLGPYEAQIKPIVEHLRQFNTFRGIGGRQNDLSFMYTPLRVMEFSSREEQGYLLDLGGLQASLSGVGLRLIEDQERRYVWLDKPYEHGFGRALIQYGNVNGMPAGLASQQAAAMFKDSPFLKMPLHSGGDTTSGFASNTWSAMGNLNQTASPQIPTAGAIDPGSALAGRSIYANVAHLMPELNRTFSLIKQAVVQQVRGTWTFRSRDGQMITANLGDGSINPMRLEEQLERVQDNIQAQDALAIAQLVSQEISEGTVDLRFILAAESDSGAPLRARLEQAALVGLDDYRVGAQQWARSVAETFIAQYRASKGKFKDWSVTGRSSAEGSTYFIIDIDDEVSELLTNGKEPPVIEASVKVAMPVDMTARLNMAKIAIDPNNPVMSLAMALDLIMEFDDPQAAEAMILQDVGNRSPRIQLIRIAQAFIDNGAPEIAQQILADAGFQDAFAQDVQSRPGGAGTPVNTTTPSGAAPGIPSNVSPPEQTSGGGTEPQGPTAPTG